MDMWLLISDVIGLLINTVQAIDVRIFLQTAGVILLAFGGNSIAGFGSGSISMGFVVQWWAYSQAVFLISVQEGVSHGVLMIRNRRDFLWKSVPLLVVGALCGIYFGIWFIQFSNPIFLRRLLGLVILLGSFRLILPSTRQSERRLPWPLDIIAGFLTGVSGALFNIEGPIIALYLSYRYHNHRVLRAQIILVQALIGFAKIVLFTLSGLISLELIFLSMLFIPFTLVGSNLGHSVSKKMNSNVFRIFLGLVLIFAGLNLLFLR